LLFLAIGLCPGIVNHIFLWSRRLSDRFRLGVARRPEFIERRGIGVALSSFAEEVRR
jgi:hypothetical protein